MRVLLPHVRKCSNPHDVPGVDVEKVKMFLDEMSPLGSIRLIVNTGVSVRRPGGTPVPETSHFSWARIRTSPEAASRVTRCSSTMLLRAACTVPFRAPLNRYSNL